MTRPHAVLRRGGIATGLLAGMLLATIGSPALAGEPITNEYSGAGSCGATLQACIDAASAGEIILIATDVRIDEDLRIQKSLVITAKRGFHPVIGSDDPRQPRTIRVNDEQGTAIDVTLADLRFDAARIDVRLQHHDGGRFSLLRSSVHHRADNNNDDGVAVTASIADARVTLVRNVVRSTGSPIEVSLDEPGSGAARVRIVNNRVATTEAANAYHGIELKLWGGGAGVVDVHGNVIRRAMGCNCGGSGALFIGLFDRTSATVDVVGNTIDRTEGGDSGTGIDVERSGTGGRATVNVFDNVITNGSGSPFEFPAATPDLVIRQGWNAIHGNARAPHFGGYPAARAPIRVEPGFVDAAAGDYRLRATSALRDRGETCTPGGLARTDAAGRFRVAGRSVDIGAYEFGAPAAGAGVVRIGGNGPDTLAGTTGRDILCGMGGADSLLGRAGRDVLSGGRGSDAVDARDGRGGDLVDGGPGSDTCRTDPADVRRSCP